MPLKVWSGDRLTLWKTKKVSFVIALLPAFFVLFFQTFFDSIKHRRTTYLIQYPGFLDVPVVRFASALGGGKVLYDPFVSLYDTIVSDRQLCSETSILGRLLKAIDISGLRLAHKVLCDTPETGDYLALLSGSPRSKFSTLWIGADEAIYAPPTKEAKANARLRLCTELGLDPGDDRFIVLYYGNYIPLHGVDAVVQAATSCSPRVVFVFVGDGQERSRIEELAKALSTSNIFFLERRTPEKIRDLIWGSDLTLGVFGTSEKAGRVLPNKVMEGMACGQVVLTANTPAINNNLRSVQTVVREPAPMAESINLLATMNGLDAYRDASRQEYLEKFSESLRIEQIKNALTEMQ